MLTRRKLIDMYIRFFEEKGHKRIETASLIPVNDPTVLFTTAGMHPLVPFLLGEPHPSGKRLVNVQTCLRTNDIEEVGDMGHLTFFEMLGNWSLGDYFKEDAIAFSYEFLTSPKYLGFDKNKIAVTVFAGDETAPRDDVSAKKWEEMGIAKENIFYLEKEHNWWGLAGGVGPCGPDTEMFIDTGKPKCSKDCSPACKCGKYLEIWNDVFMQYVIKSADEKAQPLQQKNVDTGMGVERVLTMVNGLKSVYETECFKPVIEMLEKLSNKSYSDEKYSKAFRVISEHIRSATMILGDKNDVVPSNVGQGYVLRRLIRRAINYARKLEIEASQLTQLCQFYIDYFKADYTSLEKKKQIILEEFEKEIRKFENTINGGYKEFEKAVSKMQNNTLEGEVAFRLYDTFGFPIEITQEMCADRGIDIDMEGFFESYKKHQELSRSACVGVFKGGLADDSYESTKYHTATHLMLAGLRKYLGEGVHQKGCNITDERVRFDFSFDRKLTDEEIVLVEKFVNDAIDKQLDVVCEEMPKDNAYKKGALGDFGSKYNDIVKVYSIIGVSCEICGGPHVCNTKELGKFKIVKQESSSAGVRRLKAILE